MLPFLPLPSPSDHLLEISGDNSLLLPLFTHSRNIPELLIPRRLHLIQLPLLLSIPEMKLSPFAFSRELC